MMLLPEVPVDLSVTSMADILMTSEFGMLCCSADSKRFLHWESDTIFLWNNFLLLSNRNV